MVDRIGRSRLLVALAVVSTACGGGAGGGQPVSTSGAAGAMAQSGTSGSSGPTAGSAETSGVGASGSATQSGTTGAGTTSSTGSSGTSGPSGGATAGSSTGTGASTGTGTSGAGFTGSSAPGPSVGGGASCKGVLMPVTSSTASGASVAVAINASGGSCTVAPDFAGTNYESFPSWGADVSMSAFQQQSFKAAGVQLFRYPGGEPGEWFDLLMTGKCSDNSNANWAAPPYASLWTFAQAAGLHSLMLQTNPTTQFCGTGMQDSSGAHAAAIASDVASHGVNAVYEVGNEPDISGSYFAKNGGQSAYIAKFIEHANAIHGVQPAAQVYGPVVCGLGGNCSFPTTWDSGWIDAFLAQTGDKATGAGKGSVNGISFHVYWHPEWGYSDLQQAKTDKYGFALYWANTVMPYLRGVIAKRDSRDLPIAVSEISIGNGVASDSSQTQNTFSVLETLDVMGAFAVSGVRSFQWFDANAAGPNDFWMITTNKTRPVYYSFVAWSKMGNQVLDATSNANPHDVAAYATKKSNGAVQVLLINKTNSAHPVALTFTGFSPAGKTLQIDTAGPAAAGSDASTSIQYNGATDPLPSALPPSQSMTATANPTYTVPAYSFAVLSFGP